jgi:glycosyltransferase involved in cell wall biosynthesis
VAVPSYGYGHYLRQSVDSVLAQGLPGLRVLVLDDCSPDDTSAVAAALARADARVSCVRHPVNHGHIATFNEGVEWARADYHLLLSADDWLLPGALARAVALLDANPAMTLCVGHARVQYADGRTRDVRVDEAAPHTGDRVLDGRAFVELLIAAGANNTVVAGTAVVRTRWLHETGGYREDMPHTGDLEMWLRLAAHGTVGIVDATQAVYRRHDANMSSAYARDYGMGDLQQRRDAFDAFLAHALAFDVMPGARLLHGRLRRALAREAVGQASQAFSDGVPETSRRLLAFAIATAPSARYGLQRARLALKQALGVERSNTLRRWWRGDAPPPATDSAARGEP